MPRGTCALFPSLCNFLFAVVTKILILVVVSPCQEAVPIGFNRILFITTYNTSVPSGAVATFSLFSSGISSLTQYLHFLSVLRGLKSLQMSTQRCVVSNITL